MIEKLIKVLKITSIIFLCVSSILFLMLHVSHQMYFKRYDYNETSVFYRYKEIEDAYPRHVVSFKSLEVNLKGYIYGQENTRGLIVFSHGLEGGADDYLNVYMFFVDQGFRVFSFDQTGSYHSEGKNVVSHAQSAIDLDFALNYVYDEPLLSGLPIILMGHSWGGYGVLAVLNYNHQVSMAISLSGYDTPLEQMDYQMSLRTGAFNRLIFPYLKSYLRLRFDSLSTLSAIEGINQSNIPIVVVQGSNDPFYGNKSSIYANKDKIKHDNTSFVYFDDAPYHDHMTYLYSLEAANYQKSMRLKYADYKILVEKIDKHKWNETNQDLFMHFIDLMKINEII